MLSSTTMFVLLSLPVTLDFPSNSLSTHSVNVDIGVTRPSLSMASKNSFGPKAVRTIEGARALIVIPSLSILGANDLVRPSTACLEVPYRASFGQG